MKKILLVLLLPTFSITALACDPAAFDFDLFLRINDKNHDGFLTEKELLNADMNRSYNNELTKPINTKEAFRQLDKNQDQKLSKEELWEWGRYNVNGCEGWPWQ